MSFFFLSTFSCAEATHVDNGDGVGFGSFKPTLFGAAPALINATSTPSGAYVYLDYHTVGQTPINITGIKEGKYSLVVQKRGYDRYTKTVAVKDGDVLNISVNLSIKSKDIDDLRVVSSPSQADLVVDGEGYGKTPQTAVGLDVGKVKVIVSKAGYESVIAMVGIKKDRTTHLNVKLTPKSSHGLMIKTKPAGAYVYFDGMYMGRTPRIINDVSNGEHTLMLRMSGYVPVTKTIKVSPGSSKTIVVELENIKQKWNSQWGN